MKKFLWINLVLAMLVLWPINPGQAQDDTPVDGPVYVVKAGDTLWGIANLFGITLEDLVEKNGITDPGQLSIGARLVIPGLEGLRGELVFDTVPFGESFHSLSRRYQIPYDLMARLNDFTTPLEVAAGSTLILTAQEGEALDPMGGRATIRTGQSLLEMAITQNSSAWSLLQNNGLNGSWDVIPGDVFHIQGLNIFGPGAVSETITDIDVSPLPPVQGQTVVVNISADERVFFEGFLVDHPLNFFTNGENGYVALHGVHAMQEPGLYPIEISGMLEDGTPLNFSQLIVVEDGAYPFDPPLAVNSETVDVDNTAPEDLEWFSIVEPVTSKRMWDGKFESLVPEYLKDCYPSWFGHRRSYNGSAYLYFHTGLDFCGQTGVEIYAPAPGNVVFAGPLTVRGNATVIDHGWGVYTAYAHQSEILVEVGDQVETGQVIGLVGATGRVTGPHLHWEVIVGGVQVDPLPWLNQAFP